MNRKMNLLPAIIVLLFVCKNTLANEGLELDDFKITASSHQFGALIGFRF